MIFFSKSHPIIFNEELPHLVPSKAHTGRHQLKNGFEYWLKAKNIGKKLKSWKNTDEEPENPVQPADAASQRKSRDVMPAVKGGIIAEVPEEPRI